MKFDRGIVLQFENIRNDFLTGVFSFISDAGSIIGLLFMTALLSVYLLLKKRFADILFLMIVFWGSRGFNSLIKHVLERERPDFNPVFHAAGFSFPSGHAMNSSAVLGFICFLLCIHIKGERFRKGIVMLTVLLVLFIGTSRIYLGVHYLSDIIGGYLAGMIWMLMIAFYYRRVGIDKS
jgi:undecaprenyl-diphosphatase